MDKSSMKERIEDKMQQVQEHLDELLSFKPATFEEYKKSALIRAASERVIEKIAESLVDLAVLVIRLHKFESPEDDDTSFQILCKSKVIEEQLAINLRELKGMRNRLVHQYEKVDDPLIFKAIDEEIERDVHTFLESIERKLNEPKDENH